MCDYEGRKLNVEWEKEGQSLNVCAGFDDENPSLEDLGLRESILSDFDENELGTFEWSGTTWVYANSEEISFFENDSDDEELDSMVGIFKVKTANASSPLRNGKAMPHFTCTQPMPLMRRK